MTPSHAATGPPPARNPRPGAQWTAAQETTPAATAPNEPNLGLGAERPGPSSSSSRPPARRRPCQTKPIPGPGLPNEPDFPRFGPGSEDGNGKRSQCTAPPCQTNPISGGLPERPLRRTGIPNNAGRAERSQYAGPKYAIRPFRKNGYGRKADSAVVQTKPICADRPIGVDLICLGPRRPAIIPSPRSHGV